MVMAALVMSLTLSGAPSEHHLKVRVLFGDQPAPRDTEVRVYEPSPLCGSAQRRGAPMRSPDANGWVTFDDVSDAASLEAEHPSLGTMVQHVDRSKPVVLRFRAGLSLTGVVLDELHRPAQHARVYVVPRLAAQRGVVLTSNVGTSHLAIRSLVTGPSGHFEFLGLEKGTYAVLADDFSDVLGEPVLVEAGAKAVTLHLRTRFRVEGRVVDARGKPVNHATVVATLSANAKASPPATLPLDEAPFEKLFESAPEAFNPNDYVHSAQTSADGTFSLSIGVPGPVVLEARADCAMARSGDVSAQSGQQTLRLLPLATARGWLVQPDGGTPHARAGLSTWVSTTAMSTRPGTSLAPASYGFTPTSERNSKFVVPSHWPPTAFAVRSMVMAYPPEGSRPSW